MAADLPGSPQEPSRHPQPPQGPGPSEAAPPLSQKQKKDLLKDNFEKMKRDADELADLAKSLQEDSAWVLINMLEPGSAEFSLLNSAAFCRLNL